MKRFFTLLLCLLYTFITFGGTIFVHNCGEKTLLSVYEKSSHDNCPICTKGEKEVEEVPSCNKNSCNDVEINIDQISDQLFSSKKSDNISISPFIFLRYWVELKPSESNIVILDKKLDSHLYYSITSPPTYILYCNIRN